jgi:uncharacterized membrane protein HdeD (DUF308 family)
LAAVFWIKWRTGNQWCISVGSFYTCFGHFLYICFFKNYVMKLGYRTGRNILFLILGFIAVSLKSNINGLSFYFGVAALSSAGLTLVYILLHFDENISREIITEMVIDGFSGLIIFTYPNSNNEFYMVIFSFWLAVMGTLMVTSGLLNKRNKDFLWLYVLLGISYIVSGFSIMNVSSESLGLVNYFMGFVLIIYAVTNTLLLFKRKQEIY